MLIRQELKAVMRSNIASHFIGAAFCIFFGYFASVAWKTGDDLFSLSANAFIATLRVGGPALIVVGLLHLLIRPWVLLVDTLVTMAIGVMLALTGLGMFADGGVGMQAFLNFFCAYLFINAGMSSWQVYKMATGADPEAGKTANAYDERFEERYEQVRSQPAPESLASQLKNRQEDRSDAVEGQPQVTQPAGPPIVSNPVQEEPGHRGVRGTSVPSQPVASDGPIEPEHDEMNHQVDDTPLVDFQRNEQQSEQPAEEPESGGFLESFADEEPPHRV